MKSATDPVAWVAPVIGLLRDVIAEWSAFARHPVSVPENVLTVRSKLLGLPPPGAVSANGTSRLMRCADGWLAVSLPRREDLDLVPALTSCDDHTDPWECVSEFATTSAAADVVARATMLGLPIAQVGERRAVASNEIDLSLLPRGGAGGVRWRQMPRVIDLSSLWAGPLCGALLAQAGCDVWKVEHADRRDTTQVRSPEFDRTLNGGKRIEVLDIHSIEGRAKLDQLVRDADVVITSSRPRTFAALGLATVPDRCVWIAVTAHGLRADQAQRVGFGDDCAAAGGLLDLSNDTAPAFIGDALADPLTGLVGAATALRCLALREVGQRDVSLAGCAAAAALMLRN